MTGTTERICAKFTRKTCLVLRWDDFECQGRKSEVKVTSDINVLCTTRGMEWIERNGTRSLQNRHASSRRDDSIAAEGCFRRDACAGPGGLPLGSTTLKFSFCFFLTVLHVLVYHQVGTFAGHMSFLSFLALLPTLSTTTNQPLICKYNHVRYILTN